MHRSFIIRLAGSLIGCLLSLVALSAATPDGQRGTGEGWILSGDVTEGRYYGTVVANGCLGIMSSKQPFTSKSVMLSNVYDGKSRHGVSRIAQAPDPFYLDMKVNGERVAVESVDKVVQSLDMRKAVFSSEFSVPRKARIGYSLRALRGLPYAGLVTIEVKALSDIYLEINPEITTPRGAARIDSTSVTRKIAGKSYEIRRMRIRTPQRGILICAAAGTFTEDGNEVAKNYSLRKGETLKFHILGSVTPETDFADAWNEAERFVIYGIGQGIDQLISRHEELWEQLWKGDIIIDGDHEAQKFARMALFELYSNAREGRAASIPPFGLSDREYCGHIFWDTELWMYPPMLFLNHGIARSMIDYRTERLAGAKKKAFAYGYNGALYPWESDNTGDEACPTDALTGTFEHHISSDVSIAVWNYYRMTRDKQWLSSEGWPVLKAVADFWTGRVSWNGDGSCSIRNVVGADEFAQGVDDNAFTNASAICALEAAVKAAAVCGTSADPEWERTARAIRILKREGGVTDEYQGYDGRTIKQADVNLLAYPLQIVTGQGDVRQDLEYYAPRIHPQGPAMSQAILAIEWSRLGYGAAAYEFYRKALEGHLHGPFLSFSETAGHGDTCFMTGLGGLLQTFINGFCGLELTDDGIVQMHSALPPHWKSITVTGVGPESKIFVNSQ